MNLYKFINVVVSLRLLNQQGSLFDTISGMSGLLSLVSALVGLKVYLVSIYFAIKLFPVTLGWSLSFCCNTAPGANVVRAGTWNHKNLRHLWESVSPNKYHTDGSLTNVWAQQQPQPVA